MRFGLAGGFPGHMFGFDPLGGGLMFFGFFFIIGLIVLLVWLATRGTQALHGVQQGTALHNGYTPPSTSTPTRSQTWDEPVEIARQRLAHGEIDVEQYNEIINALGRPTP